MTIEDTMKVVLVAPEIPYNTGAIGRTCLALGLELILIRPLGFSLDDRAVRRAGMDYWQHVAVTEYDDWATFIAARRPDRDALYFFEDHGTQTLYDPKYRADGYLVFGNESAGLSAQILMEMDDRVFRLPMPDARVRSLNLANTATAVMYQAMRKQLGG